MLEIRRASDRGRTDAGWLDSRHTFSFGQYYDPEQTGFSDLLVINDDRVAPGGGFGTHGHRDMEIFSYVLDGALAHKDSTGTGATIRPGDVQMMSAGSGVFHSEFNGSESEPVHFLQIWIVPNVRGVQPRYQQKAFADDDKRGTLRLIISPSGERGSLSVYQDVRVYAALLDGEEAVEHQIAPGRCAYVHVASGRVSMNGVMLGEGDGVRVTDESQVSFSNGIDAELLVFDLRVPLQPVH